MQIVLLVAGVISGFVVQQWGSALMLVLLTVVNALLGMRQEGKAEASIAALQKMMIIQSKVRRDGQLSVIPSGAARTRRRRRPRSRRSGAGGRPDHQVGHPGDRRGCPDWREPAGLEVDGAGREGRYAARRPDRHGLHEHRGHARCRRDRRDGHRHVDRGRPHLRDAANRGDREDTADQRAGLADQPDPRSSQRWRCSRRPPRTQPRCSVGDAVRQRHRLRRRRDPHGSPDGRDLPPRGRSDRPRGSRRHHEAAPLGRDARLDHRRQLRQDGDADPEPDDRHGTGAPGPSIRHHRRRVLHERPDHRPRRHQPDGSHPLPSPDGPRRRCRRQAGRAGGRSDRRGPRRARLEGGR